MGIHILDGGNHVGTGIPIYPPVPSFAGRTFGVYLFGVRYPQFARIKNAGGRGSLYDWSGNGRHLTTLGAAVMGNWGFQCAVALDGPKTPFTLDDVAGPSDEFTFFAFINTTAASKPVNLMRTVTNPYASQVALFPGASPARVDATQRNGGSSSVATASGFTDFTGMSLIAATFSGGKRQAFFKSPTGNLVSGEVTSALALSAADVFEFGAESSSAATGTNTILMTGFARGVLTSSEIETVQTSFRTFHAAVGSGLTV